MNQTLAMNILIDDWMNEIINENIKDWIVNENIKDWLINDIYKENDKLIY